VVHSLSDTADVEYTVKQSKEFLNELIHVRGGLANLRALVNGLDEEVVNVAGIECSANSNAAHGDGSFYDRQTNQWKRNLLRQIESTAARVNDLIEIQRAHETLVRP
jgi:hypothetical protein